MMQRKMKVGQFPRKVCLPVSRHSLEARENSPLYMTDWLVKKKKKNILPGNLAECLGENCTPCVTSR